MPYRLGFFERFCSVVKKKKALAGSISPGNIYFLWVCKMAVISVIAGTV